MLISIQNLKDLVAGQLKFDIAGVPPSADAIKNRLDAIAESRLMLANFIYGGLILQSAMFVILALVALTQALSLLVYLNVESGLVASFFFIGGGLSCLIAALGGSAATLYCGLLRNLEGEREHLEDIIDCYVSPLVTACAEYPECESYRQRVAALGRPFVNAERELLLGWEKTKELRDLKAKLYAGESRPARYSEKAEDEHF
ncbi:uncharacterized protein NMK_2163 [Novimethylophilus kurashikiensis]|uniref:Uncharacterized protein n=1 Tax=Novimethylophilus kurashikiensis TaxID=1825523 RepID=A0A2R5FD87_9PROT|nr:hypothetical protein [Novimethylophilus kurashikiensis]GBG14564.1 uncharacterized protein NMK_2163 [Novimethylophilus kurashikiensis]